MFQLIMDINIKRQDAHMKEYEENSDLSIEEIEQLWDDTAYISPTGINYFKLYRKNKL